MSQETQDPAVHLRVVRKKVGVLAVVGLIYFSVSGGPFGLEESISSAGPGMTMLMLLLIPVVFAVPCSLMAAELAAAIPVEGGYYYWVKIALGRFAGFTEGAWQWLTSWLDTALYPVVFADYVAATWFSGVERGQHVMWSGFGGNVSFDAHWLLTLAFMVPLVLLNVLGIRAVGDTSVGLMVVILAPFAVLTALGLWKLATTPGLHPLTPFTSDGQSSGAAFGAALGIIIWNYIGWESVSTVVGEMERPQRTYPRALLWSVPLITITYVLPVLAALGSGLHDDVTDWADGDFALVGELLGGTWLKWAVTIGVMIAQIGLFSSLLMSGSRVPMVLAGDGYLPTSLARTHPRFGTPVRAIVVSALIFAVFTSLDFTTLVDADVLLNLAALLLMFVALIVLRRRFPAMRRPFRVPGGWFGAVTILVLPAILTAWLLRSTLSEEPGAFWIGIALLVLGVVAYLPAKHLLKRGRPDAEIDVTGVDFGPGLDAEAIVRGEA